MITASRKQRRLQQNPWLPKDLLISIKNKQKLFKTCFLHGNNFQKTFHRKYSNKLTRVKSLSKKLYFNQAFSQRKNNPRELWKLIKLVIPSQKLPIQPTKLLTDNGVIEDSIKISEHFNNYFSEIGANIAKNASINVNNDTTFKKYLKNSVISTIILDNPQTIEVYNIINSLNPHKALGHDNISFHFLRLGSEVLAPILAQLFSHIFELGYFPQIFKTAKVIPVLISGNKELLNNYRPISFLPCLSKVLKKLIKTRFLKFFDKQKILYGHQYGFRKNHSVVHALLDVTSLIYNSIQDKKYSALLFNGFRKAFDTMSHKILLQKLYHYGVRGPAHLLIESYLTERKQYVSINNCASSTNSVRIGVPQGSIFRPLLYLIYVNDLCNATTCNPRLFADDTCLFLSDSSLLNLELNCNTELQNLNNWCIDLVCVE